jgi:hypothetical protein
MLLPTALATLLLRTAFMAGLAVATPADVMLLLPRAVAVLLLLVVCCVPPAARGYAIPTGTCGLPGKATTR